MSWFDSTTDVVLDDAAFEKAISDFAGLAGDLTTLRADIETALEELQRGFDTPAGRKFINSCTSNLLEPIDKQQKVITHISETLQDVETSYAEVFTKYQELNNDIQSFQT